MQRGTLWSEIERLKDKGNFLSEDQILWLLLGICRGLEAIHAKGYAHRSVERPCILGGAKRKRFPKRMGSVSTFLPKKVPMFLSLPGIPASLSWDVYGSFSLPSRDLKPTNILLGDEGQPVLMDLGSMNQARIHVEGSRQALTLQVRISRFLCSSIPIPNSFLVHSLIWSPDCGLCPTFALWGHCSRTGQHSGAPSPTVPRSSSLCRASVSLMSGLMSG